VIHACPCCGREQGAGLMCDTCTSLLERDLGDVPAIVAELDTTLAKQGRIGGGGSAGLARERMPLQADAMDPIWVLGNVLTTWARDVCGDDYMPSASTKPPAVMAAWLLLSEIPTIRKHPACEELLDEITDAIRLARRTVDRPADREFVGPCNGVVPDDTGRDVLCTEDLYARRGAAEVRCQVCGETHDVAQRRAWLLDQAADRLFTVREAAQMMGDVGGIRVTEAAIRGYIFRGRIGYHTGKMIRLGDLLAVVIDDGERRSA
jgi:hypothetical protein